MFETDFYFQLHQIQTHYIKNETTDFKKMFFLIVTLVNIHYFSLVLIKKIVNGEFWC